MKRGTLGRSDFGEHFKKSSGGVEFSTEKL
jgi:hypothetical protein